MIFEGFEPWSTTKPKVELRTPAGPIDLHNNACFEGFEYIPPDTLLFRFSYEAPSGTPRQHPSARVELRFEGVRNFAVSTDAEEQGNDADM